MLSRVAENIYWMARYVERAENTARIVTVNANLLLDLPKGIAPGWRPLVDITGANLLFEEHYKDYSERNVVRFLLADERNSGSIVPALVAARENCRTIRDFVPREVWELLNEIYLFAREDLPKGMTKGGRHAYLKRVIQGAQNINGLLSGTMLHDQGYDFLHLGRFLERADMTTRIIDVRSANLLPEEATELRPFETIQWVSVLKSMTAYQAYRRSEQIRVLRGPVLRFLFQNEAFPRSVVHCIEALRTSLSKLPRNESALRVAGRLKRNLEGTEPRRLNQQQLHAFIDDLQVGIGDLHEELARTWFPPPPETQSQSQTQD
ncbi:alpha-E domain-containing protein [Thiocapsa bogorovii]|uniref:alpha-E domain-containing protein n=1 Tax=Thiocapsa bogorovii TaxID=521689 RepID=UPI001E29E4CA|nr:alpha-E domain-containing protein [Thiocapsa bogorovii]UHD18006.1 alpha-E domain-containing protein [Thiocapsa bogorovii]